MWRYLKAAFWARPPIPGLGHFPINLLTLACAGLAGVFAGLAGMTSAMYAVWLIAAGVEAAYLFGLASNARFQKMVDAEQARPDAARAEQKRQALLAQLDSRARVRYRNLQEKIAKISQVQSATHLEELLVDNNEEALQRLALLFLRLLIARHFLCQSDAIQVTAEQLRRQTAALKKELDSDSLSPAVRQSKQATLAIQEKRFQNLERRDEALKEIESDLDRIQAQVEFALENAVVRGRPQAITGRIELASDLLDAGAGVSETVLSDLEELDRAVAPAGGKTKEISGHA